MKFYSTANRSFRVSYEDAVWQGLAPDGGLFMPERMEKLPKGFFDELPSLGFKDLSYRVAAHLLDGSVSGEALRKIVENTVTFDAPLVEIEERVFALELFHGPTLAFKDFGARFLAATIGVLAMERGEEVTILVATSGDTGSAVAHGFFNVPNTNVVVLYPSDMVSPLQEMQFTTLGGNVTALEVAGTFDDCQRLVKAAFADTVLRKTRLLTSANSISIARLIPQMFYYFRAVQQVPSRFNKAPLAFSVPSGNFGNLTAGIMAKKLGLRVDRFIAATNANDIVPRYLQTKEFTPRQSVATISNAMDVGNPSNFARILDLFDSNHESINRMISGQSFSDPETKEAIRNVNAKYNYLMDPHGAVGYLGLKEFLGKHPDHVGIFLETAHPAKFREVVEKTLHTSIEIPERLSKYLTREKQSIVIGKDFMIFKDFLMRNR